jgi:hypothetical protein
MIETWRQDNGGVTEKSVCVFQWDASLQRNVCVLQWDVC